MTMLVSTILTNRIRDDWLTWSFAQMYAIAASSGPIIELWSALEEETVSYSRGWHEPDLEFFKPDFFFRVVDIGLYSLAATVATSVAYVINKQRIESPAQSIALYLLGRLNILGDEANTLNVHAHGERRRATTIMWNAFRGLAESMRNMRTRPPDQGQDQRDINAIGDLEHGIRLEHHGLQGEASAVEDENEELGRTEAAAPLQTENLMLGARDLSRLAKTVNTSHPSLLRTTFSEQAESRFQLRKILDSQGELLRRQVQLQEERKAKLEAGPENPGELAETLRKAINIKREMACSLAEISEAILSESQKTQEQAQNAIKSMESTGGRKLLHVKGKNEEPVGPVPLGQELPLPLAEAYNMERESYQKEISSLDQMAESGRQAGTLIKDESDVRASEGDVLDERLQAVGEYLSDVSKTTTRQRIYLHRQAQLAAKQRNYLLQQEKIRRRLATVVSERSVYVEECAKALISEAHSIHQRKRILEADQHILSAKKPSIHILEDYAFQLSQTHHMDRRVRVRDEQISGLSLQEAGLRDLGNSMHGEARSLRFLQEDLVNFADELREEALGTELEEKSFELEAKAEEAKSSAELVVSWGTTSNALKAMQLALSM
ncbi:early endosome antigen 1 [Aspergillus niger]|nr:early endosome antigen 1 [Aspergillus niger]